MIECAITDEHKLPASPTPVPELMANMHGAFVAKRRASRGTLRMAAPESLPQQMDKSCGIVMKTPRDAQKNELLTWSIIRRGRRRFRAAPERIVVLIASAQML